MRVELRDLREQPVDLEVDCAPAALDLGDPNFRFNSPVLGAVRFSLVGDKVMALGRLETKVGADCVRCLKPIELKLRAPVDVIYEKTDEPITPEKEVFGDPNDERIAYFRDETIRPEPQLREAIMIELPQFPVCSEHCKGLCPKCGADLNQGTCACNAASQEVPAWKAKLKDIKLEK